MRTNKPKLRVVDVPKLASAEDAERLLDAPCQEGYYLYRLLSSELPENVGMRAVYSLRVRTE